jgi:hypothetical protein
MFFDRQKIIGLLDETTHRAMSRFGAYVMSDAKGYIRDRKKASLPGRPPNSHEGSLRRFIFFHLDPIRRSVVIGPMKLNQLAFNFGGGKPAMQVMGDQTVPQVLEYGGTVGVPMVLVDSIQDKALRAYYWKRSGRVRGGHNNWQRIDWRFMSSRYAGASVKMHGVRIEPRPFMSKAFKKNIGKLDKIIAASVKF